MLILLFFLLIIIFIVIHLVFYFYCNKNQIPVDFKKYDGLQVTITVYNQFGKLLQTAQIEKASTAPFRLEFGDMATGSYLIRVQAQGKKEVMRKLQIAK